MRSINQTKMREYSRDDISVSICPHGLKNPIDLYKNWEIKALQIARDLNE